MPQPQTLAPAQLIEVIPASQANGTDTPLIVPVQFNPQSLKLSYSNQWGSGNQQQGASVQFVGTSTTKLSMELWFDVTLPLPKGLPPKGQPNPGGDVRKLTQLIAYFMTVKNPNAPKQETRIPPSLRFQWGSFVFNGTMDTMDETIDLFSPDGMPLRSNVSIGISKHDLSFEFAQPGGPQSPAVGMSPLATAKAGDSLPQMAAKAGVTNWQGVAQANGIANPRLLQPGTMINLSITA